jgi:hypothetical protein
MSPKFQIYLLSGTLEHCRRLWNSGMKQEAIEVLATFLNEEENVCEAMLLQLL